MPSLPGLIPLARELIAQPSVSSVNPHWDQSNAAVIEQLHGWFSKLGFQVETLPIPGQTGKFNLIASAGKGPRGLLLAGHTDTVPFDAGQWRSDPFVLSERNQRLYGLGSADMKSFFAFVIEAVRELDLKKLRQPLTIIATADEESNMCGARHFADMGRHLGRYTLVGEPTDWQPIRMHKGIAMESIRISGQSGHSSDPSLGNSALEGMHKIMAELLQWRKQWQQQYSDKDFAVPFPTLNLGHIHGGDNPNRICADCELQIDLRPLPGQSLQSLREEIVERLQQVLPGGLKLQMKPLFAGVEALQTPADSEMVRLTESLTGYSAGSAAFATEAPFFNALGMQSVILGPGSINQAHQPDEYLSLAQIEPGVTILKSLIKKLCLHESA
ncbi:MAG: acetylornithine deacetylase [gamma proteobacterium symbiont of Bathyaustriella thionipta]|nr:acetylornithine deacetylase [gamma proteobacterium symbiont of Bathyaustriella thionipta]